MTEFRRVTDDFSVAPQISPADLTAAAAQGFRLVINNRPDGESPDQPSSTAMADAAEAAGLAYLHLPIRGMPTPDQAQVQADAAAGAAGPTLAFCRSGTRSIAAWALGQAIGGTRTPHELIGLCRQAGYDMSALLGGA